MRIASDGSGWMALKQQAKRAYESRNYTQALELFQAALLQQTNSLPGPEQQVLLSNIVACRLQIGGIEQAQLAVQDAQRCIRCNETWAKGHLRLAEAYIAVGGHSNQACNSLQTALRLDPGLSSARQLLIRELRRDHRQASSVSSSSSSSSTSSNHEASAAAGSGLNNDTAAHTGTRTSASSSSTRPIQDADLDLDDTDLAMSMSSSWNDRMKWYSRQVQLWYQRLSPMHRKYVHLVALFVLLYVAFGGRFGLDTLFSSSTSQYQGNYGPNNAYEQYRRQLHQHQQQQSTNSYGSNNYGQESHNHNHYHVPRSRGSGYGGFGLFGGSLLSGLFRDPTTLLILGGAAVMCHQLGINPWYGLVLLNRLGGGGRRHYYHFGGFGGGLGGGGWRYAHNGRHRRGWPFR